MRSIPLILAAFVASGPAAAQSWEEYSYPDYAFSVAFPANPQVETMTYQAANGRSVPAHIYSVRQNNSVLKVTVAEIQREVVKQFGINLTTTGTGLGQGQAVLKFVTNNPFSAAQYDESNFSTTPVSELL